MFRKLKEKIVAGLLSCACACVAAGAGFGVGAFGVNADSANGAVASGDTSSVTQGASGADGMSGTSGGADNPSVTDVTAPFTQGSLGDSILANAGVVSQGEPCSRDFARNDRECGRREWGGMW